MSTISLNIYPGRDRPVKMTVYQDGAPLQFITTGVSKMLVEFDESAIVADSSIDPTLIVWDDVGQVFFDFGGLGLDVGTYVATLIAFDPVHPNGQPVVSAADGNVLQFTVVGEVDVGIVVEDGTGKNDANAYIDVTFADTYFSDRGKVAWAALTSEVKKQSIIKATDYIDATNYGDFDGDVQHATQSLQFPRDKWPDSVPVGIKKATAEYALRASSSDLSRDPSLDPSGYAISEETTEIGPIKKGIKYAVDPYSPAPSISPYPAADNLLKPFISSGNVFFIKRA